MSNTPGTEATETWIWPRVPKGTWGPRAWNWLHVTAINYPREPTLADARRAFRRIWNFVSNLPCAECREHAVRHVIRSPPTLTDSDALQAWVWRFHNVVNACLGKRLVSYEEYRRLYADEICWANWSAGRAISPVWSRDAVFGPQKRCGPAVPRRRSRARNRREGGPSSTSRRGGPRPLRPPPGGV